MDINQGLFWGYIQDGKIFNQGSQQIGVLMSEYEKAVDMANKYRDVLYEKGILVKPKTPEEINKELQDTISVLVKQVSSLTEKIEGGKQDGGQKSTSDVGREVLTLRKTGKSE